MKGSLRRDRPMPWAAGAAVFLFCLLCFGCASHGIKGCVPDRSRECRGNIVGYAVTLLGKPYRSAARGPDAFDCSGLVYHVYKRFDITLPVSTAGLNQTGAEIGWDDVMPGDLVIFKIKKDHHVGIMLNGVEFIHASKSRGVTLDRLDSKYWKKTFSGFRRVI